MMSPPDLARLPWYCQKLLRGERCCCPACPIACPTKPRPKREYCRQHGLRAHLSIPYQENGTLLGGLCVSRFSDSPIWDAETQRRIALLAQVFANALYRNRAHRVLPRASFACSWRWRRLPSASGTGTL